MATPDIIIIIITIIIIIIIRKADIKVMLNITREFFCFFFTE